MTNLCHTVTDKKYLYKNHKNDVTLSRLCNIYILNQKNGKIFIYSCTNHQYISILNNYKP